MSRIPQNDPEFLAFQRQVKARQRSAYLKKLVIIVATVVLFLSLLGTGVVMIYRAGKDSDLPALGDDPTTDGIQNNNSGTQNGGEQSGNGTQDGSDVTDGSSVTDGSDVTDGSSVTDGSEDEEKKKVVYIDAGHGFTNSVGIPDKGSGDGTPYFELTGKYESDLNLEIALKLKQVLLDKGYEVIMIREDEVAEYLNPSDRAKRINSVDSDIFISIHANAHDNPDICGARVYYSSENMNAYNCQRYASTMANALNSVDGASQKPVTVQLRDDVAVIKGVKVPTVLVETCFLTSPTDAALAATEEWQQKMADGMAIGIENYLAQKPAV